MDELLTKYILGEATLSEKHWVEEWLAVSEDNRRYFKHFKLIWDTSKELKVQSSLDPDVSWHEFKQLVAKQEPQQDAPVKQLNPLRWVRIAAVWLIVAGIAVGIYTLWKPQKEEMLTLQAINEAKTDTLSDGSVITLNKGTVLTCPRVFAGNVRNVELKKGEAFFDIAHNKQKPFIISINDVKVRVVGTSFNIKNMNAVTEVIVETGVVQVIRKKVVVKLTPAEKLWIDSGTGKYHKQAANDKLYNYYRTNEFVADKTPLWRVAEVLSAAYHVKITVPDKKLANMLLNTTLLYGNLEQNLEVIRETYRVRINKKGDHIFIQ
ncbi:FecR domain-containing protein [Mucilaginibacter sp. Bleaf8]|uniref:FecR domain-containing protein n=1 Tax=Mucilaginibacter sp. Bleaf8 TaxID=2834430 RepID=UPI001BCD99DB|nr:FecR domain-containing protein [Mucilaginibacter sp. Bleaf8]MBS7563736.1 FecR domain-containing protein [Mucilaginibacter sp. Bleaf8]